MTSVGSFKNLNEKKNWDHCLQRFPLERLVCSNFVGAEVHRVSVALTTHSYNVAAYKPKKKQVNISILQEFLKGNIAKIGLHCLLIPSAAEFLKGITNDKKIRLHTI